MGQVFADSSFWIALRDPRQEMHERAKTMLQGLVSRRQQMVITFNILCETQAYFCRSAILRQRVLRDLWANPIIQIEDISFQDQEKAVSLLRQHADKSYSLCDALSFVVMQRLGLEDVVTFDHHFSQFGNFIVLA